MKKGIGLLSGGLDSSVSIAIAKRNKTNIILALTFDYGQKSILQEIKASRRICSYFDIPHKIIKLDWFKDLVKGLPLVNKKSKLPHLSLSDLNKSVVTSKSARDVWIPNRNGIFIHIAAAFAESLRADYVITGFNKEEAETFPDNSFGFITAINSALTWGTRNKVKVISFTMGMNKTDIIRKGIGLKLPLKYTWSCYAGGSNPCGKCESCLRRERAFINA
jgi:7-cyano-7-deazaguanine synthase